ncbi:hypothetical protein SEA_EASTWEST_12 [Arthrobacter phage EastWest]|uniref:Uncharacterized protein n=1 Tax=Arthrobacter phage EastWest TaxID=2894292 RepID=A0AAE8YK34_9CAUD|nr:hypothetical protein SEA_EASTWEST_12 [Arthrobacter phage EastWest]
MAEPLTWGVTVDEVSAFAPHIGLVDVSTAPAVPIDDVYGETAAGKITRSQVQGWIEDCAARVQLRLVKIARLIPDTTTATVLARACHDTTAVGAASYLVAAAHPSKAGLNDATSYSAELRQRFEDRLDELAAQLDAIVDEGDSTVVLPRTTMRAGASGNFPVELFPDGLRW